MNDPRDVKSPDYIPDEKDRLEDPDKKDPPKDPDDKSPVKPPDPRPRKFTIRIDRKDYAVPSDLLRDGKLTGRELRRLPDPNIGPERDLFEVVPGGSDRKIENEEWVRIQDGMRFFSAPAVINPGNAGGAPAEGCGASH